MPKQPKFFLSTPIYYVNDVPHLGHAYSTITADVVSRWRRLAGDEVFFMTGTDEHGLKVQRAAEANGVSPIEQADQTSKRFAEVWESLNISNDFFMRTTSKVHHSSVQQLLTKCYENGHIYKDTYDGLYSVSDEAYVTQADVDEGRVQGEVEHMVEENYFFRLSAFEQRLLDWYEQVPDNIVPKNYKNEALGIIKNGLEDVSITRTSLDWGVKVPWDDKHVFYVWYDALINYATAVGYGSDEASFASWWESAHHLIGKDIIRFHCVYWPAMLMAAGIETMPKMRVHGWLLVGGAKMSKSKLNKIAPADLTADFGVDGFRYCLMRDNSFGPDSDFSYEEMEARYNSDLANGLGNLLGRVTALVEQKCDGAPAPNPKSALAKVVDDAYIKAAEFWGNFQSSKALEAIWSIVSETNDMISTKKPWELDSGAEVDLILGDCLEALRILAILLSPAMPEVCQKIFSAIGIAQAPQDCTVPDSVKWGQYQPGAKISKSPALFPRIG